MDGYKLLVLCGLVAATSVIQANALELQGRNIFMDRARSTAKSPLPSVAPNPPSKVSIAHSSDGFFHAEALVNGVALSFIVDTGANMVALTMNDAKRAGIDTCALNFNGVAQSTNGNMKVALITLDSVTLAGITLSDVQAIVVKGEMPASLLGMSFLSRVGGISIKGGTLVITP